MATLVIDSAETFDSKFTPHLNAEIDHSGRFLETHVEYRFDGETFAGTMNFDEDGDELLDYDLAFGVAVE